uniref:DUF38 domain-containing protein n=1 Tax=Panagrolaimus davidi TaxID=227884 RepID=A0A914PF93_9BILA
MYEDDSIVTLEKIVEALPKLTILAVQLHDTATKVISSKTVYELLKISHFSNLENLRLFNIPQCFDIDCFFKYIKKNKEIKSALDFSSEISDEYKKQLEAIVEEIVEKETHDYKVPWICFSGIDYTSFGKIKMLVSRQL